MKCFVEFIISKLKDRDFAFDEHVTSSMLISLILARAIAFVRGLRFIRLSHRKKLFFLGRQVRLCYRSKLFFGESTSIGDYCELSGLGRVGIIIGDHFSLGAFSSVVVSRTFGDLGSHIRIGDYVGIGEHAYIGGAGGVDIGSHTIVGQYFSVHPENHCYNNVDVPIRLQPTTRKGIRIGENCWIGSKVTILDGVVIGNNCVIGAGAVVNDNIPDNSVAVGVPAKVVKNIKS